LCNDSHGDATLSKFDNYFEFIGVIGKNNRIIDNKLDDYFVLPRSKNVDLVKVKEKMKGPKYKLTAERRPIQNVPIWIQDLMAGKEAQEPDEDSKEYY